MTEKMVPGILALTATAGGGRPAWLPPLYTPALAPMTSMLDALASLFPYPAFVLDAEGCVVWMSQEGALRLAEPGVRVERAPAHTEASPAIPPGRTAGARLRIDGAYEKPEAALRAAKVIRRGERVVIRPHSEGGRPMVIVTLAPGLANVDAAQRSAEKGRLPGLGPVESAVARLAVEGFTVTNMAVRLGISESTVKTHLRRIYAKLKVGSRAELAFALFGGRRTA